MPTMFRFISYFNYVRYGLEATLIDVYGFDRCAAQSTNDTINVMDAIPMEKMLEIYGSEKIDADSLVKSIDSLMIGSERSDSIILDNFDLDQFEFYRAIVYYLIIHQLHIISYYCILFNCEKNK